MGLVMSIDLVKAPGKDVAQPSASTKKSAVRASPGFALINHLWAAGEC
jgi:hypothetical protein